MQDLSTITFTDPSVERFAKAQVAAIAANQTVIEGFAKALVTYPVRALETSLSVKLAAVRQREAQAALELVLDMMQYGDDKTWAYMKIELQQTIAAQVVYAASTPSRSTCAETNDMARLDLRAKAEMLDRVTKGRF